MWESLDAINLYYIYIYKPTMTGDGKQSKHTTHKIADDWGMVYEFMTVGWSPYSSMKSMSFEFRSPQVSLKLSQETRRYYMIYIDIPYPHLTLSISNPI